MKPENDIISKSNATFDNGDAIYLYAVDGRKRKWILSGAICGISSRRVLFETQTGR